MGTKSAKISLTDVHPGVRVVKVGQEPATIVTLGDVATAHFDRCASAGTPISRKYAWRLAVRDFGNGVYELPVPASSKRRSSTRTKVPV